MNQGLLFAQSSLTQKRLFYTVPHSALLEKIEEIDFHPAIGKGLQRYLTWWQQRTVISGCISSTGAVLSGVPQGSILDPLLFLLYINLLDSSVN